MCGRYSLFTAPTALADRFGVPPPEGIEPRYNCAPGQELPVVVGGGGDGDGDGGTGDDAGGPATGRRFARMEWGLTPAWADESFDLINARAETVREKPAFREAFERRRCLVPADGFYEWVDEGGESTPYRVAFEDDRPFAMAGVYERWEPPTRQAGLGEFEGGGTDTEPVVSYAVITVEPNDVVAPLHDRMAAILDPGDEAAYLRADPDAAADLLGPHPGDRMRSHRVSSRVNSPGNDDPGLIEPVDG